MIHAHEGREPSKSFATTVGINGDANGQTFARHLLSKQELAIAFGVSPRTIDNLKAQRKIPFLRLSSRLVRFNLERVKTALARYEVKEVGARR
jgi:hypothetical protein